MNIYEIRFNLSGEIFYADAWINRHFTEQYTLSSSMCTIWVRAINEERAIDMAKEIEKTARLSKPGRTHYLKRIQV